jgi:hypothetical protein
VIDLGTMGGSGFGINNAGDVPWNAWSRPRSRRICKRKIAQRRGAVADLPVEKQILKDIERYRKGNF